MALILIEGTVYIFRSWGGKKQSVSQFVWLIYNESNTFREAEIVLYSWVGKVEVLESAPRQSMFYVFEGSS